MIMRYAIIFLALTLLPQPLAAATISVEHPGVPVGVGRELAVRIWLATEAEAVNAVEGRIRIPTGIHVDAIDTAGSAFPVWVEAPSLVISDGVVSFSGGIPGGIPPSTQVLLFTMRAHADEVGEYAFIPESVRAYRNDGNGTPEPVAAMRATVAIDAHSPVPQPAESRPAVHPLIADIGSDPSLFDGRYFLAFYGGDAGSGVSHYEVKEGWFGSRVRADRYYVLEDQELGTSVRVTAVRVDGSRESVRVPASATASGTYLAGLGILLVLIGAAYASWRRRILP